MLKKLNRTEIGTTLALYIPLTNLSSFYDCVIQLLSQFSFRQLGLCIVISLMLLISRFCRSKLNCLYLSAYNFF